MSSTALTGNAALPDAVRDWRVRAVGFAAAATDLALAGFDLFRVPRTVSFNCLTHATSQGTVSTGCSPVVGITTLWQMPETSLVLQTVALLVLGVVTAFATLRIHRHMISGIGVTLAAFALWAATPLDGFDLAWGQWIAVTAMTLATLAWWSAAISRPKWITLFSARLTALLAATAAVVAVIAGVTIQPAQPAALPGPGATAGVGTVALEWPSLILLIVVIALALGSWRLWGSGRALANLVLVIGLAGLSIAAQLLLTPFGQVSEVGWTGIEALQAPANVQVRDAGGHIYSGVSISANGSSTSEFDLPGGSYTVLSCGAVSNSNVAVDPGFHTIPPPLGICAAQ